MDLTAVKEKVLELLDNRSSNSKKRVNEFRLELSEETKIHGNRNILTSRLKPKDYKYEGCVLEQYFDYFIERAREVSKFGREGTRKVEFTSNYNEYYSNRIVEKANKLFSLTSNHIRIYTGRKLDMFSFSDNKLLVSYGPDVEYVGENDSLSIISTQPYKLPLLLFDNPSRAVFQKDMLCKHKIGCNAEGCKVINEHYHTKHGDYVFPEVVYKTLEEEGDNSLHFFSEGTVGRVYNPKLTELNQVLKIPVRYNDDINILFVEDVNEHLMCAIKLKVRDHECEFLYRWGQYDNLQDFLSINERHHHVMYEALSHKDSPLTYFKFKNGDPVRIKSSATIGSAFKQPWLKITYMNNFPICEEVGSIQTSGRRSELGQSWPKNKSFTLNKKYLNLLENNNCNCSHIVQWSDGTQKLFSLEEELFITLCGTYASNRSHRENDLRYMHNLMSKLGIDNQLSFTEIYQADIGKFDDTGSYEKFKTDLSVGTSLVVWAQLKKISCQLVVI